ncbi:MAG TPA: hypothetical protein GXZ20_09745 [Halanaerobiaceae bacterium]|jgi:hypothetical protein|nr:hypothetical protein [Halanaerobiaceae bacterium]
MGLTNNMKISITDSNYNKRDIKKIWLLFAVFFLFFIINFTIKTNLGYTQMMWRIFSVFVLILSIFTLVKIGLPGKKQVIISFVFGILMFLAYQGVSFSSVETFLVTFFCSVASFSIFEKYNQQSLKFLRSTNLRSISGSIIIGLLSGLILGVINLFLAQETLVFKFNFSAFLIALSPAIYEEIALRAFVYAFCLYLLNGEINTKSEGFACYWMMIVPHAMIHTPDQFVHYDLVSGLFSIILLSLLFGLPFALLQKKRDISSAMIAHGVVMVIRFLFLGLPY